ncbi:PREDICTED: disease resistance-like protein CSA1 [Camelina sativa]|uniref:Disease resistance-like protein CSA1 n=1 Tax=Camelina sativa TaxID=90675 RepID=A0ABM0WHX3_CAMSA|nr:PREDICTED: disease resistance-like protein CSA1 [Camelina sativa]
MTILSKSTCYNIIIQAGNKFEYFKFLLIDGHILCYEKDIHPKERIFGKSLLVKTEYQRKVDLTSLAVIVFVHGRSADHVIYLIERAYTPKNKSETWSATNFDKIVIHPLCEKGKSFVIMRYDVFLSFSGEYIRKTFLSHLLCSLDRKGIRAATSAESYPMYNQAIEQCLVAISLISENYTSLDLWVDELAKIIKCAEDRNLTAFPVFLQVHPSDVLRVVSLAEDFADRNGPRIIILETVKNWLCDHLIRNSGFDSRHWEDDSKLVDKITNFVADTLMSSNISSPSPSLKWATPKLPSSSGRLKDIGTKKKGFVHHSKLSGATELPKYKATKKKAFAHHSKPFEGMDSPTYCLKRPAEEVCELLCAYSTKEIGIHGMEGVGKTILAKYIYEVISPQFQHHIFMDDLTKQESSSTPSLLEIFTTKTSFNGSNVIKELVGQRKILVVGDSVDDIKQLQGIIKVSLVREVGLS